MARRMPPPTNGILTNGNAPPPSTLAAQIVQNQTKAAASQQQQNGEQATFAALLHEILHNDTTKPEEDMAVNAQLISVVVEAGLLVLLHDNPFAQSDQLVSQATDSLAVIEATFKRKPELLSRPIKVDGPPVCLWLLARLFSLVGRPKCLGLPLTRLIFAMVEVTDSSPQLWKLSSLLMEAIRDSVNDTLSTLEANTASPIFSLNLPPARCVTKLWPRTEGAIALPHDCQAHLSQQAHAFLLVTDMSFVYLLDKVFQLDVQMRIQRLLWHMRPSLQQSQLYEAVLDVMLTGFQSIPKVQIVSRLLQEHSKSPLPENIQLLTASTMLDMLKGEPDGLSQVLLPPLQQLGSSENFEGLVSRLKIMLSAYLCRYLPDSQLPDKVRFLRDALQAGDVMEEEDLQFAFKRPDEPVTSGYRRARKRRRLDLNSEETSRTAAIRRVSKILAGVDSEDLSALPDVAPNVYHSLDVEDQCAAWQALIQLAPHDIQTTIVTTERLMDLPELAQSKRQRVLCMLAVQACAENTSESAIVALGTSSFSQLCLRNIQSSLRELRVAAGQCLTAFLRDNLPTELRERNRSLAVQYLRTLSDRNLPGEQETLITTWSLVGIKCGEKELNLALLRLVDYLGNGNALVSGLASCEIENVAVSKDCTVAELFRPFWPSIAVSVVQDLLSRPQKAQQLCELLGKSVDEFLRMTQSETLPSLVLTKRKDVLCRIAAARGDGATIRDIILQPKTNFAAIVSVLLTQPNADTEVFTIAILNETTTNFHQHDLSKTVKEDPVPIACELLKAAGDELPSRKTRTYQAFYTLASIWARKQGQAKAQARASKSAAAFFEEHLLGIMTSFSGLLEEDAKDVRDKSRCLKAIAEMIVLARQETSVALPQLRACLQSAIEQPELCEDAFSAWLALLPVLESEDIALIADQTLALIVRHWDKFSSDLQTLTHERLSEMVRQHNSVIKEEVMSLPALSGIPLLSKIASEIERFQAAESAYGRCRAFAKRLRSESKIVILRALQELVPFLEAHQELILDSAASEQPGQWLSDLIRSLLDVTVALSRDSEEAAELCGKSLGIIGCVDPNRIDASRKKDRTLVLSNFEKADETIKWTVILLQIMVKAFKSATNASAQGFLAFTMQELLKFCKFDRSTALRPRATQGAAAPPGAQRWFDLPEHVRTTLTPFLSSRYVVTNNSSMKAPNREYPSFSLDNNHSSWLRSITFDLMWKAKGDNPKIVFPLLARIIRAHDLTIARFVLPYALLNVVLGGTVAEVKGILDEMLAVLRCEPEPGNSTQQETMRACTDDVFAALDYMSTWLREKRKALGDSRANAYRTGNSSSEFDEANDMAQIESLEQFLTSIPAVTIASRAMECGSYARALFNWEQHIRQSRPLIPSLSAGNDGMYEYLQDIYAKIDEPDGLEGISAHLPILSESQQATLHVKAGRWSAAQAWYEMQLNEYPEDGDLQLNLLQCLRETGRYDALSMYSGSFLMDLRGNNDDSHNEVRSSMVPVAVEAAWLANDDAALRRRITAAPAEAAEQFDLNVGKLLILDEDGEVGDLLASIKRLRKNVTSGLTDTSSSTLQGCHLELRRLHILHEIEAISTVAEGQHGLLSRVLTKRLDAVGSSTTDKQSILGVRRVLMESHKEEFGATHTAASWLTTARLARKAGNTDSAYRAIFRAYEYGVRSTQLEEARLLWHDGHNRQAIHALEQAIASGIFEGDVEGDSLGGNSESSSINGHKQNMLLAKAHLLVAKWLDASGQTQAKDMTAKYQCASRTFQKWEKGHYYLGKHYNKLLEAEKALPKAKQTGKLLAAGELTRLVVENLMRSIPFGNKYWYQTIPKVLTLWLDLGMETIQKGRHEDKELFDARIKSLQTIHRQLRKYIDRIPPYIFYTALPQMLSRISHPNPEVWKELSHIIVRIVSTHPSQALWSLLAVTRASDRMRLDRSGEIIKKLKDPNFKAKGEGAGIDLRVMINSGQRLSEGLLHASEAPVEQRTSTASLSKDLGFNHKLAPCPLVVPIEATLTANLPTTPDSNSIRTHKAFAQERITIQSFEDYVLVLSSLQRPKKVVVRGSDGKQYGIMCKPKDDLRKDQRLMEFNGIINRALKRDPEASKRRLYIKTYAVTPLSEESGILEWVEGIKPIRDILLNLYARKGIRPDYRQIRDDLNVACAREDNVHVFMDKVQSVFPATLHEWFTEVYPEPDTWFAARLRYARTAAVMSMTGHMLGLGDRHGENILLQESTGGVFHVDFNCLFDKGLTFEKPELVPFRLTRNMVDAMGPYGYEGPFRRSCELTLGLLRQNKDTLMTILETFLYDPTTDFVGKKKRNTAGVPETPQEILDSVEGKLKGLLRGETVPLSVEGYVDALIREAVKPWNLCQMYIGWCAFL